MQEENRKIVLGIRGGFIWGDGFLLRDPSLSMCYAACGFAHEKRFWREAASGVEGARCEKYDGIMIVTRIVPGASLLRCHAMAGVGAADETIDQRAKVDAGMLRSFRK